MGTGQEILALSHISFGDSLEVRLGLDALQRERWEYRLNKKAQEVKIV